MALLSKATNISIAQFCEQKKNDLIYELLQLL